MGFYTRNEYQIHTKLKENKPQKENTNENIVSEWVCERDGREIREI